MRQKKIHIITIFLISLSVFTETYAQEAKKGYLDLSDYIFEETKTFTLNGIWEFYPSKLYTPEDFEKGISETPLLINVPDLWNNEIFPEKKHPETGYGTYRLKIKVPANINYFALRLLRIETAYKIWINDNLIVETGKPGQDPNSSIPAQKTVTKVFYSPKTTLNLVMQVSNFSHRKGGIANSIYFGTADSVLKETKKLRGFEIFLIGVLLIMAFFHLGLYVVRKKDYSLLFFALLLISEIISITVNGETLLTLYLPDLKWIALKRTDYISNFLRITFFALFFYQTYKEYINKYFVYTVTGINLLMTLFVLFTDLLTFSFTLFVFIGITAITLIYVLFAQTKAVISKRKGSVIPLIGTAVLLLTAINDILVVSGYLDFIYLVPAGLFVFILAQSYLMSFNFSQIYKEAEELNKLTSSVDKVKNELLQRKSFDIKEVSEILCKNLNADRGFIFSINKKQEINVISEFPETNGTNEKHYPSSFVLNIYESGKSGLCTGSSNKKLISDDYIKKFNVHSAITVPIKTSEDDGLVIHLERLNKKHGFTKYETRILEELAVQINGLAENAKLYEETQNITKNLEKIIEARTLDVKNQQNLAEEQKSEIETINNRLSETLEEIKTKNEILTESIKSAKLIQKALLPEKKFLESLFSDIFILYRPKEIVSGDFYYAHKTDNGKVVFAVSDCTGHGVPGVLISLIGYDMLNNAVINMQLNKPSAILEQMRKDIAVRLGKTGDDKKIKDGMDIAVITFDKETLILEYAGAKTDLLILRNNKLTEVKADKITISADMHEKLKDKHFKNYKIQLKKGDILYLATDGYQDQFGGENDTKFMKKNFRALLTEIGDLQFNIQRSRLLKTLNRWQGGGIQNDDITVIGIKI